jgi:methylenetetrahydrofolate--tRNA-(uracil-5-)-methyltransferase
MVHIIGAGLAGSEAAWQIASRGVPVVLHEMRPGRSTGVHQTGGLAELVCSNSFRSDKPDNAVGVLKLEMRELGSLVMRVADRVRVPAGAALAVDRARFSTEVTDAIVSHPLVTLVREEIHALPPPGGPSSPVIVATGPLTSEPLSAAIAALVGASHLYFYDAVSPIVLAETIDRARVFRASRWGRSLRGSGPDSRRRPPREHPDDGSAGCDQRTPGGPAQATAPPPGSPEGPRPNEGGRPASVDAGDYLNCPLDQPQYERFHRALVAAERASLHDLDERRFFEGCLPIEVMADRGVDTLRFGPMKPVGLVDPRTGRPPYAVVQLRQDTLAADHFSMVGFQTQLKWGEQPRVFRLIPGLEQAEFVRFGMIHRNTYINAPRILTETWQARPRPDLLFAGQLSGVEGYVESAASGLLAGLAAVALVHGRAPAAPPRTTALGALAYYVSHADPRHYDPTNITFGIMPALPAGGRGRRHRQARNLALAERALADIRLWKAQERV